jgi:glycosyltransferase involved in cell wall biosynthesis
VAPEISVIVPAYNAALTVDTTIDSVLAQTFGDFELIVVDDGSRDATPDVVASRDDPRVHLIRSENRGVSSARNLGLEHASGTYLAFLDSDDAWLPEKLERQHAALESAPEAGVCFASAQVVDDEFLAIGLDPAVDRRDFTKALLLEGNIIAGGGSSVMARASLVEGAGGFDTQLSQCADWDMWLRLSSVTRFIPLEDALVQYRSAPGSMSSNPDLLEQDTFALLDKFYARPHASAYSGVRRRAYANQWLVCAGTYLHAGRRRDALRCVAAGLRSDPRTVERVVSLPVRRLRRGARTGVHAPPPSARE